MCVDFGDICLYCDLIVLDMTSFDVILGMDWLTIHRANIDYYRKRVTISTVEGDHSYSIDDRRDT